MAVGSMRWTVARAAEHEALGRGDAPPGFLSDRERAAFEALRFPARRRKWILGRWAAKWLLRAALRERGADVRPAQLTIANEPSGAPYAELEGQGRLPWTLSLSHRDHVAFAALAIDALAVGADVERVAPRDPALIRTFFAAEEAADVAQHTGRAAELAVARIWSAKEAVLKAMRIGLRLDTRRVVVSECHGAAPVGFRSQRVSVRGEHGPARVFDAVWRPAGDYVLTLATAAASTARPADGRSRPAGSPRTASPAAG